VSWRKALMIFDAVFIVGENLSDWQSLLIVLLLTPALFATSCCVMPCLSKNRANFDRFRFPRLNQLTNVITPLWKERWIFMPGWGVKFTHGCFL